MKTFDLKPQLFDTLKSYNKKNFMSDLMAGIIVGIVALPLAIAFGIASGVTPEKGIITAIVAGFLVSLLGGSKVQIGGPTYAFIVIIYGIIQKYGIEGLTIATIMAGVFLILFGLLKLGTIIKYIPYPIVVGFTSGIAVTIFTTQIKDLFGLTIDTVPSDFIEVDLLHTALLYSRPMVLAGGHCERRDYRHHAEVQQEDTGFARGYHLYDHRRSAP